MNRFIWLMLILFFLADVEAKKPDWVSKLPEDTKTAYFLGTKLDAPDFEDGKKQAIRNGLSDVMNYLGIKIKTRYEERLSEVVENEILTRSKGRIENLHLAEIYYETEKRDKETIYNVYVLLACPKETIEKERTRLITEENVEQEKILEIYHTGVSKETNGEILSAFQSYSLALKLFEEEGYDAKYKEIYKKIFDSYQNIKLTYLGSDKKWLTIKVSYRTKDKTIPLRNVLVNFRIIKGKGSIEKRTYTDTEGIAKSRIYWLAEGENLIESLLPFQYLIKTGSKSVDEQNVVRTVCQVTGSGQTTKEVNPIRITLGEFQNQSQDKEFDWLSSGIADGLMNRLSYIKSIQFQPKEESDILITGSFYKQADNLKIYVKLQNLDTGMIEKTITHVTPVSETFAIEEKLTFQIANALNIPLGISEKEKLKKQITSNSLIYKYLTEGLRFYRFGKYDDAGKMFEQAIKLDKDCATAYNNLGLVRQAQGLFKEAISHFKKSIEISPLDERFYFNLASAYYTTGEIDGAVTYYEKALEINSLFIQTNLALGVVYNEKAEYDKAIKQLKKIVDQIPDNFEALNQLGIVYDNMKNYKEAINYYREALKQKPYSVKVYNNLGVAYDNSGLYDEAITAYQNGLSLNPRYANIWTNLGLVYAHKGEYEKALSSCQTAVKINPDCIASYYNLASFFVVNNNTTLAISCIKKIVEIDETEKSKIAGNPDFQILQTNPDFLEIIK